MVTRSTPPARRIGVFGAGGFGREVAWLVEDAWGEVPCVLVDDSPDTLGVSIEGHEVWTFAQAVAARDDLEMLIAVGKPQTREAIARRCLESGIRFAAVTHPSVISSRHVKIGAGVILCAGSVLTVHVELGAHVHVNLDCTIGHDVLVGDYTTLSPGVHVSGHVHLGKRVFVGTGAVFVNGTSKRPLVIGDDAIIGAGAVVNRDVVAGTTVVGVPARARG